MQAWLRLLRAQIFRREVGNDPRRTFGMKQLCGLAQADISTIMGNQAGVGNSFQCPLVAQSGSQLPPRDTSAMHHKADMRVRPVARSRLGHQPG